jgi:hypothetical protein
MVVMIAIDLELFWRVVVSTPGFRRGLLQFA